VRTGSPQDVCAGSRTPEFDGRYSFFSAGYLEEGEPFRIKLSPDIRPGTYGFMCLVHRASMVGSIEVKPSDEERPRVADVRNQATDEEDEVASTLEPAARRAAARRGGSVLAGTGPAGRSRGLVSSFIPNEVKIGTGESVVWQLYGTHSISFDPSRDAQQGVVTEDDEGAHINLDAWRSVGSRAPPAAAVAYPPAAARVAVKGGAWSGEGAFSSGIIRASQPTVLTYELSFTKAGTYRYQCLVHKRMRGRVIVEG
jgi:plastocyanin